MYVRIREDGKCIKMKSNKYNLYVQATNSTRIYLQERVILKVANLQLLEVKGRIKHFIGDADPSSINIIRTMKCYEMLIII